MWYKALTTGFVVLFAYIGISAVAAKWPIIRVAYDGAGRIARVVAGIVLGTLLAIPMFSIGKGWGYAAFPIGIVLSFILSWLIPWAWRKFGTLVKVIVVAVIIVAVVIAAWTILTH